VTDWKSREGKKIGAIEMTFVQVVKAARKLRPEQLAAIHQTSTESQTDPR